MNEGAAARLNQAAPRPNMTFRTDRFEFSIFIDLFSLLRPFYVGFSYERQRPRVPDIRERESTSFRPGEFLENSGNVDYQEIPGASLENSASFNYGQPISSENESMVLNRDIAKQPSNAEITERKVAG